MFQHELDHLDGILLVERLDEDQRKEALKILRSRTLDLPASRPRRSLEPLHAVRSDSRRGPGRPRVRRAACPTVSGWPGSRTSAPREMAVATAARPGRRRATTSRSASPARTAAGPRARTHAEPGEGGGRSSSGIAVSPRHGRSGRRSAPSWRSSWPTAASSRLGCSNELPMVNLHFSLLPRWRGAAPVERAILAGRPRDRRLPHEGGGGTRHRAGLRRPRGAAGRRDHARRRCGRDSSTWPALSWSTRWPGRRGGSARGPSPSMARSRWRRRSRRRTCTWTGPSRRRSSTGSCASGRAWTTFRGKRLGVLEAPVAERAADRRARRAGHPRSAPRSSTGAGASRVCDACSPRAVPPCQPRSGCAVCGLRKVSVSGRTKT